jgi:hypothetical protein
VIFEYILLLTFFFLGLILFFSALGLESLKEVILIRGADKTDLYRKKNARLELWSQILLTLIFLLFIFRILLLLLAPSELVKFAYLPNEVVHLLLICLVFSVFWILIWYFVQIKKEIKIEERTLYLKKIFFYSLILAIIDVLLTSLLSFQGYHHMYSLTAAGSASYVSGDLENYLPFLIINLVLVILLSTLFILYILKRSLRILKQYWLTLLMLIVSSIITTILSGSVNLGWNDDFHTRVFLLSWQYTYVGWIFLLFLSISIFCNVASIILLTNMGKFINPVKYRNLSINMIKMGFITIIAFLFLSVFPDLLIWLYAH